MTAAEYRLKYPPPSDPRRLRAYLVALDAMCVGDLEWGPPPDVNIQGRASEKGGSPRRASPIEERGHRIPRELRNSEWGRPARAAEEIEEEGEGEA